MDATYGVSVTLQYGVSVTLNCCLMLDATCDGHMTTVKSPSVHPN